MKVRIGIVSLQGSFAEHECALKRAGAEPVPVKCPEHLDLVDGLIIPGGESTTIGKLMVKYNMIEKIKEMAGKGMPVYGTCAGMVLIAKDIGGLNQPVLGLMNITVKRNAFGRQLESFEEELFIPALGHEPFRAVFIRAPVIEKVGEGVKILARLKDKRIVAAEEDNILVSSFHPELTRDPRMHRYFINSVIGSMVVKTGRRS